MSGNVVSLGERLRLRREELGLSQAQAARELDVARTAYRLWEIEAAKPAPDRWRLISRWLGVSVATMLLAEELIDEGEVADSEAFAAGSGMTSESWDEVASKEQGDFFSQERAAIIEQIGRGNLPPGGSERLGEIVSRIQQRAAASGRSSAAFAKVFVAANDAPALARSAVLLTAIGVPHDILGDAQLLTSELVTNSVQHSGSPTVSLSITLSSEQLRVEVADEGTDRIRPRTADQDGGWGLTLVAELATRWGVGRKRGSNAAWLEFDLPQS